MLTQHIALVSDTDAVSLAELARVSAALQRQVTDELGPTWGVSATVDPFASLEEVPIGYWPLVVSAEPLGVEAGVHLDRDGQPYARVQAALAWSLDASRAALEMLVDPFGSRTALGVSPRGDRAPAEVLVEVCAPCAGTACAHVINDVIVSDFCTPAFFAVMPDARGGRYSWSGSLQAPLSVLPGGHLTWREPEDDAWWVRCHYGENPVDTKLGSLIPGSTARALVGTHGPQRPARNKIPLALAAQLRLQREYALYAATVRAERLRGRLLERQLGTPKLPAYSGVELAVGTEAEPSTAEPIVELAEEVEPLVVQRVEPAQQVAEIDRTPASDDAPAAAAPVAPVPPAAPVAQAARRAASGRAPRASSVPPSLPPSLAPPASLVPEQRLSALGGRDEGPRSARAGRRLWLYAGSALAFGGALALWLEGRAVPQASQQPREPASVVPAPLAPRVAAPVSPVIVPSAPAAVSVPTPSTPSSPVAPEMPAPTTAKAPENVPARAAAKAPPDTQASTAEAARKARARRRAASDAPTAAPAPSTPQPPVVTVVQQPRAPGLADLLDTRR